MIMNLPIYTSYAPANILLVCQEYLTLVNFDLLENIDSFIEFLKSLSQNPYPKEN